MKQRILHRTIFTAALATAIVTGFSIWKAESQEVSRTVHRLGGANTQIIIDEAEGVIRFEINGQEAGRMDAEGLHVEKHIQYGGHIQDVGPALHPMGD